MSEGIALSTREHSSRVLALVIFGLIEVLVLCLVVQWMGMQWMAWSLFYDPSLAGALLFDFGPLRLLTAGGLAGAALWLWMGGWRSLRMKSGMALLAVWVSAQGAIYHPLMFWEWREVLLSTSYASVADAATYGVVGGWACVFLGCFIEGSLKGTKLEDVGSYGTGKFGSKDDMRDAGFFAGNDSGLPVGFMDNEQYLHDGEEHALVMGATGTGKTAFGLGPIILCHGGEGKDATGGAVVYDPKEGGELFALTAARMQAKGRRIYRFDPRSTTMLGGPRSRINPLVQIPMGEGDIAAVQRLSEYFSAPLREEKATKDDNWVTWAREIFECLVLHVLYVADEKNIGGVIQVVSQGSLREVMMQMVTAEHDPEFERGWRTSDDVPTSTHPHLSDVLVSMVSLAQETLSGVEANLKNLLRPYRDPLLREALRCNDFDFEELYRGKAVLYLTGTSTDSSRMQPVMQMILDDVMTGMEAFFEAQTRKGAPIPKTRLLVVIDELSLLGTMARLQEKLQTVRSSMIRIVLGVQTIRQLRKYYGGENELISVGCPLKITLGAEDQPTAKYLSEMIGDRTVKVANHSMSSRGGSVSTSEIKRPVMTPDELRTGTKGRAIVLAPNMRPVMTDVRFWFEDPELAHVKEWIESSPPVEIRSRVVTSPWFTACGRALSLEDAKEAFAQRHPESAESLML